MSFTTDLVDNRGLNCSIWINLMTFPMPSSQDITEVGLSVAQLQFAQATVLDGHRPNTATTLYYLYCSIRVNAHIPHSFATIKTAGWPHTIIESKDEEQFDPPVQKTIDTRSYLTLKPEAVVVAMSQQYPTGERVTVYRNLTTRQCYAQFRHRDNHAYPLIKRLGLLLQHSSLLTVTNASIRQNLGIRNL